MINFYSGNKICPASFLQRWSRLGDYIGVDLYVQRDDLLPAPLAGNKWIKLLGEVDNQPTGREVFISNGGTDSNHCRTVALWGAQLGVQTHFVLHGPPDESSTHNASLQFFHRLGSKFDVVSPDAISDRIECVVKAYEAAGFISKVIPGGGHSPAGVKAYRDYAAEVIATVMPDTIVHASGTGGTQAGIIAACREANSSARVVGVSVARSAIPGKEAIRESLRWLAVEDAFIDFRNDYVDGGYGRHGEQTDNAVNLAWHYGMPLDHIYTGKAFAGLMDLARTGEIEPRSRVLFWHTGGSFIAFSR